MDNSEREKSSKQKRKKAALKMTENEALDNWIEWKRHWMKLKGVKKSVYQNVNNEHASEDGWKPNQAAAGIQKSVASSKKEKCASTHSFMQL